MTRQELRDAALSPVARKWAARLGLVAVFGGAMGTVAFIGKPGLEARDWKQRVDLRLATDSSALTELEPLPDSIAAVSRAVQGLREDLCFVFPERLPRCK